MLPKTKQKGYVPAIITTDCILCACSPLATKPLSLPQTAYHRCFKRVHVKLTSSRRWSKLGERGVYVLSQYTTVNSLYTLPHVQTYSHGESIKVNVSISNRSSKTVKRIKIQGGDVVTVCVTCDLWPVCFCTVRQFASICLFAQSEYKCVVAQMESE